LRSLRDLGSCDGGGRGKAEIMSVKSLKDVASSWKSAHGRYGYHHFHSTIRQRRQTGK
jgi:hypothetical protein